MSQFTFYNHANVTHRKLMLGKIVELIMSYDACEEYVEDSIYRTFFLPVIAPDSRIRIRLPVLKSQPFTPIGNDRISNKPNQFCRVTLLAERASRKGGTHDAVCMSRDIFLKNTIHKTIENLVYAIRDCKALSVKIEEKKARIARSKLMMLQANAQLASPPIATPFAKIINPRKMYTTYPLDVINSRSECNDIRAQTSEAVLQDISVYSHCDNWPFKFDSERIKDYRTYVIASFWHGTSPGTKVLVLRVPASENGHMPADMRLTRDIYFLINEDGVEIPVNATPHNHQPAPQYNPWDYPDDIIDF